MLASFTVPTMQASDGLTHSSFSSASKFSSSRRCFSIASSSYVKSRTINLCVKHGKYSQPASDELRMTCETVRITHFFSRAFCANSSFTRRKSVTENSANSSSCASLLQAKTTFTSQPRRVASKVRRESTPDARC